MWNTILWLYIWTSLGDGLRGVKNRLREIRHELLIDKQIEMANLLGVPKEQYNRYERNQVQPTLEMALKFANKLNKSVEEIFYRVESPG